jgi:hypothetical protein
MFMCIVDCYFEVLLLAEEYKLSTGQKESCTGLEQQ